MRFAQITNNKVVNIIEAESQEVADQVSDHDIVIQSDEATMDWVYDEVLGLRDNPQPTYDEVLEDVVLREVPGQVPIWSIVPKYSTPEEEAEAVERHRAQSLRSVRLECRTHIVTTLGWTEDIQRNIDGGRSDSRLKPIMDDVINACRVESNRCEDLIELGQPYTAVWPMTPTYAEAKEALV